MAKISLRAYDHEIEDLIERGHRLDEAIAHCHHILKTFPKHLATYRLLGKAYLEAKRYGQAVDIFQRVLLAAPEDFVSHVGMSIIADDQGKLDDAIWDMERAFEVQPSNAAIQSELQRLFGRRDGVQPPKIRLTRGALAYMYVRGELYPQAVSEIRGVLAQDPKRADMQVLLAKAYLRSGQKAEAAEICSGLLSRYPYCLEANRLMLEILPGTDRADSGQEYRQRLTELDPYLDFVRDSASDSEHVADNAVMLERLQDGPGVADASAAPSIGLATGAAAATGLDAGQPSWLAGVSARRDKASSFPSPQGEIPDFLRRGGWTAPGEGAQHAAEQSAAENEPVQDVVPGALPDWVKALAPTEQTAAAVTRPEGEPQASEDELPEWLRNIGQGESGEARPALEGAPDSEAPGGIRGLDERDLDGPGAANESVRTPENPADKSAGWAKDVGAEMETPAQMNESYPSEQTHGPAGTPPHVNLGPVGTIPEEQDGALAWLESLAEEHGAKKDELVTDPGTRSEVAPDWFDKAREVEGPGPRAAAAFDPTAGSRSVTSGSDLPGGLLGNAGSNQEATASPPARPSAGAEPRPLDWLSGLSEQGDFAGIEADSEKEEPPILEEHEATDWLGDLGPGVAKSPSIDEAPAWLNADGSKALNARPGLPSEPAPESASATHLPDWVASLDEEKSGAPAGPVHSDELPPWLHPEAEPAAPAAERTQPADWQPADAAGSVEAATSGMIGAVEDRGAAEEAVFAGAGVLEGPEAEAPALASAAPRPKTGSPTVLGAGDTPLGGAKSELGRGNIAAALDIYDKLIRRGKSLEAIIRDLRDALYRYPVEVPIWQALGDAYMRSNRLQEALDAYTKAEELLR